MRKRCIYITVPGGEDGQGGIVRQMLYYRQAARQFTPDMPLAFLQTRSSHGFWLVRYMRCCCALFWLLLRKRVALLHLNVSSHGSFYRKFGLFLLARLFSCPVLVHLHSGYFDQFYEEAPAPVRFAIRYMFCRAQKVLILGQYWQPLMSRLGVQPDRVAIQPNAVNGPESLEVVPPQRPLRLLFLGQLIPAKGVGDLITALAQPPLKDAPWELVMAGGALLEHYSNMARQAGLAHKIHFPGWQSPEAVEALCRHSDVLILPSHIENQPLVLLEAMAFGLAIIATRVGTIPEIVTDGRQGFLYEAGQMGTFEKILLKFIEDPAQLMSCKQQSRDCYLEFFTLESYACAMRGHYEAAQNRA